MSHQVATPATANLSVTDESHETHGGVTWRVVALCIFLAFFFGYVVPLSDTRMANTPLGSEHIVPGALHVVLIMLLVLNPLLGCLKRRLRFSRREILVVYICSLFSCMVPSFGAENMAVSMMIAPFYFGNASNGWVKMLQEHLHTRPWLTPALWADGTGTYGPKAHNLIANWYLGAGHPPWALWLIPLAAWAILCVALYIMLGCLAAMLRAQWAENEALAFPLLRLPLEMIQDVDRNDTYGTLGRFFRNPLMWVGFSLAVVFQLLAGLHLYYPEVPAIPQSIDTGPYLADPPWNQIGFMPIAIYPVAIGISYLLTTEVSFSLWFFLWFIKFQLVAAYYMGFMPNSLPESMAGWGKTFLKMQQIGATLGYAGMLLWLGRQHYRHVFLRAIGRAPVGPREQTEIMSYPTAFWGFVGSCLFLLGWSVAAGIRPDIALVMWLTYGATVIGLTRLVIEGGFLFVQQGWSPLGFIAQMTGGAGGYLDSGSVVPASMVNTVVMLDNRSVLLPCYLHAFKLAHDEGLARRPLLALIAASVLISLVVGFAVRVQMGYSQGGLTLHPWFKENGANSAAATAWRIFNGVSDTSWTNWCWLGVGAFSSWLLLFLRARLLWFPLHPVGWLIVLGFPSHILWVSVFIGWGCKVLITRFGGISTMRQATPAFLGLVLGDITMMLFWLLIDGWQGRTFHTLVSS